MSRILALLFVAATVAGCCISGNGCYAPVAGAPLSWDGLGSPPTETADATAGVPEERPRKNSRPKKEIIVGPIGGVGAEPKPKLEGREAYLAEEAEQLAAEARLTKKLVICTNCMPARSKAEVTGSTR
jgi:hypothetical protein